MPQFPRRVLVLANRLPYPIDDGWKSRTYHLLSGLAQNNPVTLLTFHDGTADAVARLRESVAGDLEVISAGPGRGHSPARLLLGLVTPTPVYVWNMRSRRFAGALREAVARVRPDVVVSELTYMAPYLNELPPGVLRVIDTHNIDSVVLGRYAETLPGLPRRFYARVTARKLRQFEARAFRDADLVWVCSEEELRLVEALSPAARARVIPNGVDTRAMRSPPEAVTVPDRLLFFGRLDYAPNRDGLEHFAREILPLLRERVPRVELHVVGAGLDRSLQRALADVPEIRLIGRVDDLPPHIAAASAVVVPLRMGGGTRLKILEAMSMGRPVVSTTLGAEGLRLSHGREVLLADSPADFADATARVLNDPQLGAALGSAARATAVQRFDWSSIQREALNSLRQAAQQRPEISIAAQ